MSIYQKKFNDFNITISQILLTQADFDSRKTSKNIQNTINILLENGVVPIINENDSVATDELVFGDNDQLSAYSTYYLNADILIILSDIDGYYTDNPKTNKNAKIRRIVKHISESELNQIVTPNNEFATGGIVTKLKSAKFLMDNKKSMFLSSGYNLINVEKYLLHKIYKNGTIFQIGN
jgi:glutamate 5-kinase